MSSFQNRTRMIILLVFAAVILSVYWLNPEPLRKMIQLLMSGDLGASIDYIRSFGPYAAVVSFFIVVFINSVAVLPNIFILAANGIIFGIVEGTIISWLAEVVGVVISFIFLRYFFRDYAKRVIERSNALQRVNEFSGKKGFQIMVIARSIPFIPSGLITALGALSDISLKDYILATLIGKFPSALIEVTLGHDLASYHENSNRLMVVILISIAAYGGYLWYKKKHTDR
ncbi:TVP38/TMEM64 family protein [Anaerosinus massiliensis]|uniref:TVP38/TMEM64 family protein n=1 Tax=Massilibacillus massiliensis TaxID=1806837 RepID=UPI000DA610BD|nr:TVP38/TMEM64 family protein [Massilibacillus massiliensis]